MAPMGPTANLLGFTVGVTAGQASGRQQHMLDHLGATVICGPDPRLVDMVCANQVDAVTFTAGGDVRNFMALADRSRRGRNVLAALNRGVVVACADPACAAVAEEEGVAQAVYPDRSHLGALVRLVRDQLLARRRYYRLGESEMLMQGSLVLMDGQLIALTNRERAVLAKLADHPGATFSRRVLLRHVWKDPTVDPGALDEAVAALRRKLGPAADSLETTVGRGYRLRAREADRPDH